MKRIVASMLILLQLILLIPMQTFAYEESTTLIVHYVEAEGNDKDWNLWVWPSGGEGQKYEFDGEDNYGKVATIILPGKHEKAGFIVRTDAWEKDTPNDRFIEEFNNSVGEIWVVGGQEEFYYENPNGADMIESDSVTIDVNYHNYEDAYDGVTAVVYSDESNKETVELKSSQYGASSIVTLENTYGHSHVVIEIQDKETTRYDVKKLSDDVTSIFIVENNERVFYSLEDAVVQPRVEEAKLMSTKDIIIETNMPFMASEEDVIVIVNDEEVEKSLLFDNYNDNFKETSGTIKLSNAVNYTDEIVVKIKQFDPADVQLGDVYDTIEFNNQFNYEGDLGPLYSPEKTDFKVWAPTAKAMRLTLFDSLQDDVGKSYDMVVSDQGVWEYTISGDLHNQLYIYEVQHQNDYIQAADPYAKSVTVNGKYSAVIDLSRTNPVNFDTEYMADFSDPTDAIMYEIHVRDLSMHMDSGIENKGKFLGFTELNTSTKNGFSTGLSYIKSLGVTHVQFLPIYDYGSIDESKQEAAFNWGYDPVNYNALEGSYATDAEKPDVRIMEFKSAVQAIHDQDLKVTMDVVYNHVFSLDAMAFEKLVPGYYFRKEESGNYANGSGCGNETASERFMMRKFMVDSTTYLADEYNLDGFRFDLMGLHDVETMNEIRSALNEVSPSITIIGEGWNMGSVLEEDLKANQTQAPNMPGIAHFNDTIRDGLKGSVFNELDQGFVNGNTEVSGTVFSGIIGGIQYDTYSTWGDIEPNQAVTYVEAHDNHTLFDKLSISNAEDSQEDIEKMHVLADSIILTSQGVPFIHAGQEFMRTKFGDENSYKSNDIINRLDWTRREKYDHIVVYFQKMIEMRKSHPSFTLETSDLIRTHLKPLEVSENIIAYELKDVQGDDWSHIIVIHNSDRTARDISVLSAEWTVVVSEGNADMEGLSIVNGDTMTVEPLSTLVAYKSGDAKLVDDLEETVDSSKTNKTYLYLLGAGAIIIVGFLISKRKK